MSRKSEVGGVEWGYGGFGGDDQLSDGRVDVSAAAPVVVAEGEMVVWDGRASGYLLQIQLSSQ